MRKTTLFLATLFSVTITFSQDITLQELGDIASFAEETSGIEMADGLFWTHNDSGGANEIYGFNSAGTLERTIAVTNATNVDWEDLAQDANGNFYICDFGNNNNDRSAANGTPLRIYIIPNPMDIVGNSVTAEVIQFELEDRDFSLTGGDHDFNMEAAFWWNDTLHLFNKIGGDSPSTTVKHYVLPAAPGTYIAPIVETINICGEAACANRRKRVTAADISPCGRYVILITRARMYLFNCFSGSQYFTTGNMREFTYTNTQKEAVVFDTYQDIYITDEKSGGGGGKLYYFSLAPYVFPAMELTADVVNNCGGSGSIAVNATGGAPALSYLWESGQNTSTISDLTNGAYSLTITDNEGCTLDSTFTVAEAVFNETDAQTICSGTTYTFGEQTLTASGEFTETFSSVAGCDSIVKLTLSVVDTFNETDAQTICSGTTYTFGEQSLTASGEFTETFSSVAGCDSIVTLTLSVIDAFNETDVQTICSGTTYTFGAQTLTTSGDFTETFSSVGGCDSTVVLSLDVVELDNTVSVIDNATLTSNALDAFYQWVDCDADFAEIQGATSQTYTPLNEGNFAVLVVSNGCETLSDCVTINPLLVNEYSNNTVLIYPNPSSGYVMIESNLINRDFEVVDTQGRVVIKSKLKSSLDKIDISELKPGVYVINIYDTSMLSKKIIIR